MTAKSLSGGKRFALFSALFIVLVGFGVYANSWKGQFVFDDLDLVRDNVLIRDPHNFTKLFTQDVGAAAGVPFYFYRPLLQVVWMADHALSHGGVAVYHASSTLFHVLAALALCWLITLLFADPPLSLAAALFFVVHPVHTEAVAYISSLADPLSAFFIFLCLAAYVKAEGPRWAWWTALSAVFYALGILSKEMTIVTLLLIGVYHLAFKARLRRPALAALAAITLAYGALRLFVFHSRVAHPPHLLGFVDRLKGFFAALATYARVLIFPHDLHMEYGTKIFAANDPSVVIGAALFAAAVIAFIILWRKQKTARGSIYLFSLAWFFAALLPVANLYPINANMAEHWLYLPSVGFFLVLGSGFSFLWRKGRESRIYRMTALGLSAALIAFYAFTTIRQNDYWYTPLGFYTRTLRYAPTSSRMHNNLGTIYKEKGDFDKAAVEYREALRLKPDTPEALINLGFIEAFQGHYNEARDSYEKALKLRPNLVIAHYNLAVVCQAQGFKTEAVAHYRRALELDPSYQRAKQQLQKLS